MLATRRASGAQVMMRAVVVPEFGSPEVLRVHASGVNPLDAAVRSGGAARMVGATLPYTSAASHPFLRDLGTDVVIDDTSERFEEVTSEVDVVLDPIGGDTQRRSLCILRDGGTLVALLLSLDRAAEAHEQSETGHTRGKIVFEIEGRPSRYMKWTPRPPIAGRRDR